MKKLLVTLALLALVGAQAQAIVRGSSNGTSGLMSNSNQYAVDVRPMQPDMDKMHVLPVPIIGPEVTATDALEMLKPMHIQNPAVRSALMNLHHEIAPLVEQAFNELTPAEKHQLKTVIDNVKAKAMALRKYVNSRQYMPIVAMELVKVMAIIDRKKSELATKHVPSKELATGFIALQKASDAVKHTLIKFKKEMVKQGVNPLTGLAGVGPVVGGSGMHAIGGGHYQQMLAGAKMHCDAQGDSSGERCSACIRAQLGRVGILNPPMGFDRSCQMP